LKDNHIFKKNVSEQKNPSGAQNKKRMVKRVYQVNRDGLKDKSSDLSSSDERPIGVLETLAIKGEEKEIPTITIQSVKSCRFRKWPAAKPT
jgi:hypothetical protein